MATKKPPDTADLRVRVTGLMKKSVVDLARSEGNSPPSVIRRLIAEALEKKKKEEEKEK
jgi:hypothetical protein